AVGKPTSQINRHQHSAPDQKSERTAVRSSEQNGCDDEHHRRANGPKDDHFLWIFCGLSERTGRLVAQNQVHQPGQERTDSEYEKISKVVPVDKRSGYIL